MTICTRCGREAGDGARFCEECGLSLGAGSARGTELRKTVTVLFCDLVGSTALGETLDPERLRTVLADYFARMKGIVERHGGSVEKFIGDAVVAVFGVPGVHEDDAVRAVRSAAEMRDVLAELGLEGRIGVMTGEVVTGTEERLATGDAVNVAARLQQAAAPGEVLVGQPTLALVGAAAEVAPVAPLALKGKAEPLAAYRLLRVHDAPERRHDTALVGRRHELDVLRQAWARVEATRRCELVTIVGDAGIGKSRLAVEFVSSVEARVVQGRCLAYGEGITYWPVVEVVRRLGVAPAQPAAAAAMRSLLGDERAATSAEEIAWAFRKTLEQAASARPLVVVLDDIQWGEQTFLDLVEDLPLLTSDAPILLLCLARPELGERRPGWPVALRLQPLGADDVSALIPHGLPEGLRERIAHASAGNPLFLTEILALAHDADGDVVVPATLQALLAARLDQLPPGERSVLERAAIEGEVFHRGSVQALEPADSHVTPRLAALVRKELIRPQDSELAGEDGFRFRHVLIRDAAYDALPKAVRAGLHTRFAAWLERHEAELVDFDELTGYHLEQACGYHAELGTPVDAGLRAAARSRLAVAGLRALRRSDGPAAVNLLERAAALLAPGEFDVALETGLANVLSWSARGGEALERAASLAERAASRGDRVGELCGRIKELELRALLEPEGVTDELDALLAEALPVLEAAGDDLSLYIAYFALAMVANMRGQMDRLRDAFERAAGHASAAAGQPDEFEGWLAHARIYGSTPVSELLAWLDEDGRGERGARHDVSLRISRAAALARLGRFDEARAILADERAALGERAGRMPLAGMLRMRAIDIEILAGEHAAAAKLGEELCELLEQIGDKAELSGAAGELARVLYELDRLDEADAWAVRTAEAGSSDDVIAQALWRQVRGKVGARRGHTADAERLAREAVAICQGTDLLETQGDAYADLGEVLLLAGKADQAETALGASLECYERKGNLVLVGRARTRLAALHDQRRHDPVGTTAERPAGGPSRPRARSKPARSGQRPAMAGQSRLGDDVPVRLPAPLRGHRPASDIVGPFRVGAGQRGKEDEMTNNARTGDRPLGTLRSAEGKGIVRREDRFDTDIDDLWSALTDPRRLARWIGDVEGDLRLGGEFGFRFFASGSEGTGRVEACEPPRRLLLTMAVDQPDDDVIEATLAADGDQTILVWEERGMPLNQLAAYGAGVQIHVEDLADYLAGRERRDAVPRFATLFPAYQELAVDGG